MTISIFFFLLFCLVLLGFFLFHYLLILFKKSHFKLTKKIGVSEWEREKRCETQLALLKLKNSKEFKEYEDRKKKGMYRKIELTDDDIIKFSDED